MKIYKVLKNDAGLGSLLEWHSSRAAANKALAAHRRQRGHPPFGAEGVEEINFPTDKEGLLRWLNAYFNTDNE